MVDVDDLLYRHTHENALVIKKCGFCGGMTVSPHSDDPSPVWPYSLVVLPHIAWQFSGDVKAIADHFEKFLIHLRHYTKQLNENGISKYTSEYGDWCEYMQHHMTPWVESSPEPMREKLFQTNVLGSTSRAQGRIHNNIVVCNIAGMCAGWAGLLGRTEEQKGLWDIHDTMRRGIRRTFYNPEAATFGKHPGIKPGFQEDGLDAWALYSGIAPETDSERIVQGIVGRLRERGHRMTTGVITSLYLLRTLADWGLADDTYEMLIRDEPPGAGFLIRVLPPGGMAEYAQDRHNHASIAHADFAQLADWFWYGLGGLRADEEHRQRVHEQRQVRKS